MTTPPFDDPWEKRLHEELRKLPDKEAPESLVTDVMAIIRARQRVEALVWWKRPATAWPPLARLGLSLVALAAFAALLFGTQILVPQVTASAEVGWLTQLGAKLGAIWSALVALMNAFVLALSNLSPVLLTLLAGACVCYLAMLGIGGALWRATVQHSHD